MLKYLLEKLTMDLDNILKLMLEATSCASKKIMEIYKSNFHINFKEDNSPVTSADIESNKIITSYLSNTNIQVLSEEITDDYSRLNEEKIFILDPLDGTQDFVNKDDTFGINLAYVINGEPIIGVIGLPVENSIIYAIKNKGSYRLYDNKTTKLHVSNRTDNLIYLASKTHNIPKEIEVYKNNPHVSKIISSGACTKAYLLSSGVGDISIRLTDMTKEWDVVSCDIIVRESGGYFATTKNKQFTYNKKDVINHDGYIMANDKDNLNYFKY